MKLMQVYANEEKFRSVKFNEGFNVVIGKIRQPENLNKDSHNLGKSKLIDLIDFLLLKELKKGHFFKKQEKKFLTYVFFLEIKINSGKYITIKRGVQNNTKIFFKVHDLAYQNFISEQNWDYEDLSLNASKDDENPKKILNKLLGFNKLKDYEYRNVLNYFLRTQKDYLDVFRLSKFSRGKDINWKPVLYEVLGFNKKNIYIKYKKEQEKKLLKEYIKNIEKEFALNVEEIDKINGLIQIKENEKNNLITIIDEFNFYLKEAGLKKELIEDIEKKISEFNTLEYDLEYEILEIQNSLSTEDEYNIEDVALLFDEVELHFHDDLKKSYDDLIDFNKKITIERKKHLTEVLKSKQNKLFEIKQLLQKYNEERVKTMKVLKSTDTFEKYKTYQKEIVEIEKTIEGLKANLNNIDVIKSQNERLEILDRDITKLTKEISDEVDVGNDLYRNIKIDYYNFIKTILNKSGMISISKNGNGNIEFNAEIPNELNELTSENEGYSYKKIMCACFDIALLKNYINESFFRFAYHDGSLESLDPRKKVQYLNLVKNICNKFNIQYILTLLDSDLPAVNNDTYKIKGSEIAVELFDDDDDKGRLFGVDF